MLSYVGYMPPFEESGYGSNRSKQHYIGDPQEPPIVTPQQREKILRQEKESRSEKQDQEPEYKPLTYLRTYTEYSQNHVSEAAMLCNEMLRFQQNDLAGIDSVEMYREKLLAIKNYLEHMDAYGKQLETTANFGQADLKRLQHAEAANRSMAQRITETLQKSDEIEQAKLRYRSPSAYMMNKLQQQKQAETAPQTPPIPTEQTPLQTKPSRVSNFFRGIGNRIRSVFG